MAIVDYEGFGGESNFSLAGWWSLPRANSVSSDGAGPFGIGRYMTGSPSNFRIERTSAFANEAGRAWIQGHVYLPAVASQGDLFHFMDAASSQCYCCVNTALKIEIRRGDNTLIATSTNTITLNAWHFIQFGCTVANSGSAEVWVDGVQWVTASAVDTQQTANAYSNGWACAGLSFRFANIVVYNSTGDAPTARTAIDTIVYCSLPTGAGNLTQLTPSAGSNWQNVDEVANDGDTTYNSSAAAVQSDLYSHAGGQVPAGSTVYAVGVEAVARKDDAGTNEIKLGIRSQTTNTFHAVVDALSNTYTRYKRFWTVDPAGGGAFSVTNANAAETGVQRSA